MTDVGQANCLNTALRFPLHPTSSMLAQEHAIFQHVELAVSPGCSTPIKTQFVSRDRASNSAPTYIWFDVRKTDQEWLTHPLRRTNYFHYRLLAGLG
ncbi:hypothetical protein PISMIDRAFT_512349 [Pisolithus microcarpus 441]|uniref:Uncharacterized protein n=1 Tax=Pisolithus microcarpus 441 TaxID=765257 RepID=A0A0C9Z7U7_9AGAM|nr:hypothetical protein PISMIDRAFT_512349 [Pisolithus microcarpus 441]